jgi:tRNA U34 5-methylaminomethyl-2-thiouridine-forming methyltransferase MnmC
MKLQIRKTADNSDTIFVPTMDEHYHSIHGAWQESLHVFINEGLNQLTRSSICIFEMGFGTGLNVLLTLINSIKSSIEITYHTIDLYPLDINVVNQLNHRNFIEPEFHSLYEAIHLCDWNVPVEICKNFHLTKISSNILTYKPHYDYDIVYWDAFGPEKQPDIWHTNVFRMMYESMNPEGILVTYSAKGWVRRNLEAAGFMVKKIQGPPGKREMIRAQILNK